MLFSQPDVAAFLNQNFECVWESLRPVPKVHVDFGGGTTLERTLLGNIATWYCHADGRIVDVLPGLCDAAEYLARARAALAAHKEQQTSVLTWFEVQRQLAARAAAAGAIVSPGFAGPDLAKGRVEGPIRAPIAAVGPGPRVPDASKRIVELPLRDATALDGVAADTQFNRHVRYSQAWMLLARWPSWPMPAEVEEALFDEVLHVPLADPFLGLAPDVPGGEGGRTVAGAVTTRR